MNITEGLAKVNKCRELREIVFRIPEINEIIRDFYFVNHKKEFGKKITELEIYGNELIYERDDIKDKLNKIDTTIDIYRFEIIRLNRKIKKNDKEEKIKKYEKKNKKYEKKITKLQEKKENKIKIDKLNEDYKLKKNNLKLINDYKKYLIYYEITEYNFIYDMYENITIHEFINEQIYIAELCKDKYIEFQTKNNKKIELSSKDKQKHLYDKKIAILDFYDEALKQNENNEEDDEEYEENYISD